MQVLVRHGAHAGIRPHVFRRFHHVDDGVKRKNHAHHADVRVHPGHERKREKVASHGNACVPHRRHHGDEHPQKHGPEGKFHSGVPHREQGRDKDKRRAAVHVDGRANRQNETGNFGFHLQIVFGGLHGHGQGRRGAFREKGHQHRGRHFLENRNRIQPAQKQKQGQHDKELDSVSAEHDGDVLSERPDDDARVHLGGKLGGKSHDAERKREYERADQRKEKFAETEHSLHERGSVFGFRHKGEPESRGGGDKQNAENVPVQKRIHHIVRDDVQNVVVIRHRLEILRNFRGAGAYKFRRQRVRTYRQVERKPDKCRGERREKRVKNRMGENSPGVLFKSERG